MNEFEEGYSLLDQKFGGGKDNVIAVSTVALDSGENGMPKPSVRGLDVMYEDGVFYAVTNAKSNKMRQIALNPEVSVASCSEMFTASGRGENLGWVLDPKNAEIRDKLRSAFASWYDMANNENDKDCCILAIRLTKGILNVNHWEKLYHLDFEKRAIVENAGVV